MDKTKLILKYGEYVFTKKTSKEIIKMIEDINFITNKKIFIEVDEGKYIELGCLQAIEDLY